MKNDTTDALSFVAVMLRSRTCSVARLEELIVNVHAITRLAGDRFLVTIQMTEDTWKVEAFESIKSSLFGDSAIESLVLKVGTFAECELFINEREGKQVIANG